MNKNEEVAREIALTYQYDSDAEEFAHRIVQPILDRAYPPLPADVGELVAEAREWCEGYRVATVSLRDGSTTSTWEQLPDQAREIIERLCDALEAAHAEAKGRGNG